MNTSIKTSVSNWRLSVATVLLAFLSTLSAWAVGSANIVIAETYSGAASSGATYNQKFVILFNRSASAVNVQNWTLQYASSTGTSWATVWTGGNVSIPGYSYYLVGGSTSTIAGSVALPLTPDAAGTFGGAAGAGKVVLCNSTTAIGAVSDPTGAANYVDFLGYGGANAAEGGSANHAGTPTSTTAVQRNNGGCTDGNNNLNDFTVVNVSGTVLNSSSSTHACADSIAPETAADGSGGSAYAGTTMIQGSSVTLYAIVRSSGSFFLNDTATWSLVNKTGNIVDGDLVPSGDGRSAVFTGNHTGTATIHVTAGSLTSTDSGTITVQVGSPSEVRVETAVDGTGVVVPTQSISQGGSPLTVYAIERDASHNFIANVAATWSLVGPSGNIVSGDLTVAGDNKSATLGTTDTGTTVIDAAVGGLTSVDSGTITISAQPPTFNNFSPASPVTGNAGSTVTVTGNFTGATGGYQWLKGATPLSNVAGTAGVSASIAGSQTATLTLTGVYGADAGSYYVVATNNAGPTTSSAFALNVADPIISTQPAATAEVRAGHIPVISGAATGSTPISYRWQKNGVNYPGATASNFSTTLSASDSGSYTLIATTSFGSATSSVCVVTVDQSTVSIANANQNFQKGHLVVTRFGDGANLLASTNAPISVLEYTTSGSLIQTVNVPSSGIMGLTAGGSAFEEGYSSSTPNGSKYVIVGYNITGGAGTYVNPGTSNAVAGRRSIATLDSAGNFQIEYTLTTGPTGNIRSGAADDSGNFWAGTSTGTEYINTISAVNTANSRATSVFNSRLWYSTSAGVFGLTGTPTSTAVASVTNSYSSGSPGDFAVSPDGNTMYVADANRFDTQSGGIRKYVWTGTVWTNATLTTTPYKLQPKSTDATAGAYALCVDWSGANPVIYTVCSDTPTAGIGNNNSISVTVDTGTSATGTVIASAGNDYAFRGIRFAPFGAPVVATQPANQVVNQADDATFSIALADGTSTSGLTYVWKDGLGNTLATHTPGVLTDSFTISNTQVSDSGKQIHCEVSNASGTVSSSVATLTVNPPAPATVVFDIFADKSPIYAGQTVNFEVDYSGTTPVTNSWLLNGSPLTTGGNVTITSGGSSSIVTITGITVAQAGTLYDGITNRYSPGTSSTLSYTVITPNPPAVTAMNPSGNITNDAGATRILTVGASDDSGVLTYQWYKGASPLSNGSHVNGATIIGATAASVTVAGVLGGDDGSYHCVVSNAGGSTDSAPTYEAVLFVNDPIVTAQPVSHIVVAGSALNVSVTANGTGMTFAWSKDGNPLSDGDRISGSQTSALTVANANATDAGQYTVSVNSAFGSVATLPATIIIAQTTPQALSASNIVVLQRGDGLEGLSANGNTVFLLQYTPAGSLVSCYQVPNSGVSSLIQAGNTPTEGWLTKSADGQLLVLAGYNANIGGASSLVTSTGAAVNRAVGTLDKLGAYTLAAKGTNHSGSNIRSAAADGLGNFWTAGASGGVEGYVIGGLSGGEQIVPSVFNLRVVQPINGDLFFSSSTGFGTQPNGSNGLYSVSGLPTTATTVSTTGWYIGIPTNQPGFDFGLYDYAINPDATIAYISDDQAFALPDVGGIQRYDKSGGVWSYSYRIGQASRGLTVDWSGVNPVIYATTPVGGSTNGNNFVNAANDIVRVVDTGANSAISTIATAIGGAFAGIRTAPGLSQTITFPAIADQYSCAAPIALGATASSSLPVSYDVVSGPATISGGNVVLTTPITSATTVSVRASQSGDGTYSPAASVTQTFTVNPSTPSFIVAGNNPATVIFGAGYTDAGATATNSCGDSLTVTPTDPVDTNTLGTYTVTYSATDASSSVTSTATRIVNVVAGVTITSGPSPVGSTNAQGATFTLSVTAAGDPPLTYQWYSVEGGIVAGATTAVPTLTAQPAGATTSGQKTSTNHYYVIVTGPYNSANSPTNKVVITLDAKPPTLILQSPLPKKVYNAATFAVKGTATDQAKGNIAAVRYYYVNSNTPNTTITYEANGAALTDKIAGNDAIKNFNITTNPPPLPGTNAIVAWAVDLAGNASTKLVTNVFFYAIPMPYTLHKLGDGTGSVSFKDKLGDKVSTVYFGTNASDATVNLNVGEVYTLTYTPDRRVNSIQNPGSVVSLVTNAPGMGLGTNSSKRWVGADILVESNVTSVSFEFDRDRFADMAGVYSGVFSVPNDPQIASSGLLLGFNLSSRGTYSTKIANNGVTLSGIKGSFNADGTTSNLSGNLLITGYLDWAGSATAGGIKQFIGSISNTVSGWNAPFVADRAEKGLLTAGTKLSLVLPGTNAPTGSSFAKILDSASSRAFTFTLADGAILASSSAAASASSNFPIYVYAKYNATKDPNGKSVLFGTWNTSSNQVTLNWVKQANGAFNPAGFTNVELATIAGITNGLAGVHTVTISNASFNLSYQWDFTAGVRAGNLTTPTNTIAIKQDTTGKGVTVTFGNGNKKATTIGHAGVLEDAQTADGFFFQNFPLPLPTDSGSIHIQ